jgi:hypothetical protein
MRSKFCFVAGVPGSSWSMISHRLKLVLGHDISDVTDNRSQKLPKLSQRTGDPRKDPSRPLYSHYGSYFGPHNEFGEHFDDIPNNYTLESFYDECRLPFVNTSNSHTKCIRSHWFSYNLDWLWENCKGNSIFLIYKPTDLAIKWWFKRGGWSISHPVYTWYKDDETIKQQINEENNNLLKFAEEKNLKWEVYHEGWWLEKFGREEKQYPNRPPKLEYDNNNISVIYTKIPK